MKHRNMAPCSGWPWGYVKGGHGVPERYCILALIKSFLKDACPWGLQERLTVARVLHLPFRCTEDEETLRQSRFAELMLAFIS